MTPLYQKLSSPQERILATLLFFNLQGRALTLTELQNWMLGGPLNDLQGTLKKIPKVQSQNGFYWIEGQLDLPSFLEGQKRAQDYWRKIHRCKWIFKLCPHLKQVYVCNSLALGSPKENSDIDLFIVTKSGRLFTARLWVTLWTQILGLRRHGEKIRKRFCLSFFVSEEAMNLKNITLEPEDIYLAFWLKTLVPIYGSSKSHQDFLEANNWVEDYFGGKSKSDWSPTKGKENWLEKKLRTWQLKRAQEKAKQLKEPSGTVINKTMLKFHNHDRRRKIMNLLSQQLEEVSRQMV